MKLSKALFSAILLLAVFIIIPARAGAQTPDAMERIDDQVREWLEDLAAQADDAALTQRSGLLRSANTFGTKAVGSYTCLPTCSTTDGKFLSIAGIDLQTLAGDRILVRIRVPAGTPTFELGIFDGDSGGTWDLTPSASAGVPLAYTLFEDPDGDGTGPVVASMNGASLPDNAWSSTVIATSPSAALPSGAYAYGLEIRSTNFSVSTNWSNFKIRSSGSLTTNVSVSPVAIAFTGPLFSAREGNILYPNAGVGDFTTTTYDGVWRFYLDVFQAPTDITLWDGDFDRGTANEPATYDTDDPDTPGAPFMPTWADPAASRPEGVAFVLTCGSERSATGCPADDRAASSVFRRSPAVEFTLIDPNGASYRNPNPSGNREWEHFSVSTAPFDPTQMDYAVGSLPPGTYEVRADGIDLSNLNAWRFFDGVMGVCEDGTPCLPMPRPYLIGDTVFYDTDGDGVQDPGEPGIPGVTVTLTDWNGTAVATTTTGTDGYYQFGVEAGTWTVTVDPSNTQPGGAIAGYQSTTGESLTFTVVDDNVWAYDFGYHTDPSILPECGECDGKVSSLTFLYSGHAAQVTITGRRGPDKATPLFSGFLMPGEIFTIDGPPTGNGGFAGTLGTEITIYVDGVEHAKVHTSCSQPIGPGTVAGRFEVLAGESKNGGALCPLGGGGEEPPPPPPPPVAPGTGTLGYWKTHAEAWPVTSITVGGITYTRDDAIALLGTASKGDKTYDMFHQLVAAKLNVLVGNESSCIDSTIAAADAWLVSHPVGSKVKGKDWTASAETLHSTLDSYNNGQLCAPHRD